MSGLGLNKYQPLNKPKLLSLPPNVNGRRRGTLEIRLSGVCEQSNAGIRWKSAKSYPAVEVQFLWWGQDKSFAPKAALHWEQGKVRTDLRLPYDVLTSDELFGKYLRAAEPIQARLVSSRTNTLIGTASVPVPGKIVNFVTGGKPVVTAGRAEIFSGRGFSLGEICLEFYLKFDEVSQERTNKENRKTTMVVQHEKKQLPVVMPERDVELSVKGLPAPLNVGKPAKEVKTFRSLNCQSRTKILNYLSGKTVSSSEDEALSEICSISPTESMMDALNKIDGAPEARKSDLLKSIDSARILIERLKFTKAGLKEIFHKAKVTSLPELGFLIKVKLPSQTSAGSRIKFGSTSVSDCGEAVFEGQTTAKIALPNKSEGVQFEFLVYLALGPIFHLRTTTGKLIFLGHSVIKLEELVNNHFVCYKKCPVKLASDDISIGMLTVRLELGARGLHFGPEFIDALLLNKENISISSSSSESDLRYPCWSFKPPNKSHAIHRSEPPFFHRHVPCQPMVCSHDERTAGENAAKAPMMPTAHNSSSNQQSSNSQDNPPRENESPSDHGPKAMETQDDSNEKPKNLLYGLLHLGQLKETPPLVAGGYFLVAHGFWSDEDSPILTTELCQDRKSVNYLITFPVLPDARFIERTKNQHMLVELWQKIPGEAEKLVGVTRLPLHQFYIAFRDDQLAEHLARAKLPVISIDGWSGIGSPLASEPCGQVQAILAVGTENQIEYFKLSRGLTHTSGDAPVAGGRSVVPEMESESAPPPTTQQINPPPSDTMITPSTAISSQRCFDEYNPINTTSTGKQQSEVANMLSAFIENLAQRLPISSERSTAPCYDQNFAEALFSSPHSQANRPQMRKTSELLENLQKALSQRPLENVGNSELLTAPSATAATLDEAVDPVPDSGFTNLSPRGLDDKLFKVSIEIEQAVNLPKLSVSKKYGKRNKTRISGTATGSNNQRIELEPSAYVTFEGYNLQPGMVNTVKSHEGIVYTTAVVESNSNPSWKKHFDVMLPVDLMTNDEKRFILKVWRKAVSNNDVAKCRMLPAPMEDAVVGFTAVDLSVFLNGMPSILGWYNIMDFSGRCNGQIKVNIKPLENVTALRGLDESANFQIPLTIDVECGALDGGNTSLSRALKRKFTELEEITQRLKARLFDVTGDEHTDPDDEFERDLNTEADEGDDEGWVDPLEDTSGKKRNSQYPNGALTGTTNTSSYTMSSERKVPERSLTGCSDRSQKPTVTDLAKSQLELEKLLKKHDLDTLINPSILMNLLNPSVMSTSESTPTTNPYANLPDSDSSQGTSADADMSEESTNGVTSDKVKLISTALQRTTISDGNEAAAGTSESNSGGEGHPGAEHQREAPEGEPMKLSDK